MGWKYIVLQVSSGDTKFDFPIIFPDKLVHKDVSNALRMACEFPGKMSPKIVSAGMIGHIDTIDVHGESETLGIGSRKTDAELIDGYSYNHGIV